MFFYRWNGDVRTHQHFINKNLTNLKIEGYKLVRNLIHNLIRQMKKKRKKMKPQKTISAKSWLLPSTAVAASAAQTRLTLVRLSHHYRRAICSSDPVKSVVRSRTIEVVVSPLYCSCGIRSSESVIYWLITIDIISETLIWLSRNRVPITKILSCPHHRSCGIKSDQLQLVSSESA